MKISKLWLPAFCLTALLCFPLLINAQNNNPAPGGGSCSCSDPSAKCTASVTCSNGNAVCVCSESGCTSYCVGAGLTGEFPDIKTLIDRLQTVDVNEIGGVLGKAFGKTVSFTPFKERFVFDYMSDSGTHWDILEYLSQNGTVKINGGEYAMWKRIRGIVTSGKANFCTGNASLGSFVNEMSFFAGRKYQIVGGNPASKMNVDIKGLNVDGIIEALQKHYQITIQRQ